MKMDSVGEKDGKRGARGQAPSLPTEISQDGQRGWQAARCGEKGKGSRRRRGREVVEGGQRVAIKPKVPRDPHRNVPTNSVGMIHGTLAEPPFFPSTSSLDRYSLILVGFAPLGTREIAV